MIQGQGSPLTVAYVAWITGDRASRGRRIRADESGLAIGDRP